MCQYKPIEKVHVKQDDINDRMTLKDQYKLTPYQPNVLIAPDVMLNAY